MEQRLFTIINRLIWIIIVLILGIVGITIFFINQDKSSANSKTTAVSAKDSIPDNVAYWRPVDITTIADADKKAMVEYGRDLIAHTAKYLGPNGSVLKITNGMNCQNCHLEAGTKVFGNNYGSVASLYPKFRPRSGSVENIYKRVNDCIQRSLNGKPLDTLGKEMQAISAYINFVGSNVEKGKKAEGSGLKDLAFLDRAADSLKGSAVFVSKCQSCHGANGAGVLNPDNIEYVYPPLWGANSFNDGAGLFRISNFAKYVKYNMPQGVSHNNTILTDEEAWDVAAFVVSQKRPHLDVPSDWPDRSKKPVDHPFGPYADKFSEKQHKYGPFPPMAKDKKTEKSKV